MRSYTYACHDEVIRMLSNRRKIGTVNLHPTKPMLMPRYVHATLLTLPADLQPAWRFVGILFLSPQNGFAYSLNPDTSPTAEQHSRLSFKTLPHITLTSHTMPDKVRSTVRSRQRLCALALRTIVGILHLLPNWGKRTNILGYHTTRQLPDNYPPTDLLAYDV